MRELTAQDFMTRADEAKLIRKAEDAKFANMVLNLMIPGGEYRCKDISKILRAYGIRRGSTYQNISQIMKKLKRLGLVKRIEKNGEPVTFENYAQKEIVFNGEVYRSREYYEIKVTKIPKIAYYSLV